MNEQQWPLHVHSFQNEGVLFYYALSGKFSCVEEFT